MIKFRSNIGKVFKKIENNLKKSINDAPKVLGNAGQNYFSRQFARQRFDGNPWPEVQRRMPGTFQYKYPKSRDLGRRSRPILVGKTRGLKNAVSRNFRHGNRLRLVWGVSVSYAQYLVEKRPFVRDSYRFRVMLRQKYEQIFKSNLK